MAHKLVLPRLPPGVVQRYPSAHRRAPIGAGLPPTARWLVGIWVRFVVPAALTAILLGFLYTTAAGSA